MTQGTPELLVAGAADVTVALKLELGRPLPLRGGLPIAHFHWGLGWARVGAGGNAWGGFQWGWWGHQESLRRRVWPILGGWRVVHLNDLLLVKILMKVENIQEFIICIILKVFSSFH